MDTQVVLKVTDSFFYSVYKLTKQGIKQTFNAVRLIKQNPATPSLQMHSIDRERCDKKLWSARVNLDLRLILARQGDECILMYVDHHDAAYDWCVGKYLLKTDFGTEYIYDELMAEEKVQSFASEADVQEQPDFARGMSLLDAADVKAKNLEKLGIQKIHAKNLMKIETDEQLLEYIDIFPNELQEALIDLATRTKTYDAVYNALFTKASANAKAYEAQRFYLTDDVDELEKLIENEDFEKWTLFLHPSQERLVNMNCNGPMLVEGGPGTGKTIVGIHRAVRLAKNVYPAKSGNRILVCTFSKKLAGDIAGKVNKLCTIKGISNNIDCMSVDSYISQMLGNRALHINLKKIEDIIKSVYQSGTWKYSMEFYLQEYYEIVEKYHITSCEAYLSAERSGSGIALRENAREEIWPFFEKVWNEKNAQKAYSFVDRAFQLDELIARGEIEKKYDAVIIDEAQDLESIKLTVLCNSMKNQKNGACILSDRNQRIFRLNTWSRDAGINVVGRTFHLRINYRTTKQINDYARKHFTGFDNRNKADKEYISIMSGDEPEILHCDSELEENHVIVDKAKKFMEAYRPEEICVLAPTYEKLIAIKAIFEYEGIDTLLLTKDITPIENEGVRFCTTSGVKGLEFSVVIIASYNQIGTQRHNYGCAPEATLNYEKLVECEKYVAVTRARDKVLITNVGE